jgi:hypothetical protein
MRKVAHRILARNGYRVLVAAGGHDALSIVASQVSHVDVLLSKTARSSQHSHLTRPAATVAPIADRSPAGSACGCGCASLTLQMCTGPCPIISSADALLDDPRPSCLGGCQQPPIPRAGSEYAPARRVSPPGLTGHRARVFVPGQE